MNQPEGTSQNCIEAIRSVVGDAHLRSAQPPDAIDTVSPGYIVEPASAADVAQVLSLAKGADLRVVARGGGSKMDWGNPPRSLDLLLSTKRLNRVVEHAAGDMTATVQAGCTVGEFATVLAERGQRLALDPLWPDRATIGGIIAVDDSGPLRAAFGTLRDHLIGITVALADGTLAKSGGKVVKNVAGYDLPKLFAGSFGTLGIITEATFRLYPLAHAAQTLRFTLPGHEMLGKAIAAFSACAPMTCATQITMSHDGSAEILVLVEGLPEAIGGKTEQMRHAAKNCDAKEVETPADAWKQREQLFSGAQSCVCKISLLPTHWPAFVEHLRLAADERRVKWRMIFQAVGAGLLQLEECHISLIAALRANLAKIGGSLVVLRCPAEMKRQMDIWGDAGNALPLMRRIKDQFDPKGTLSQGRFAGGI